MSTLPQGHSESNDPGSQTQESPSPGSHKQPARRSHLRTARIALLIASMLTFILAGVELFTAEMQFNAAIAREIESTGASVNPAKLKGARDAYVRFASVMAMGIGALAGVLLFFSFLASRYPLFSTVAGLILFVGCMVTLAYFTMGGHDLASKLTGNWKGLLWEAIITLCLLKSILEVLAHQRERARLKKERAADATPLS